MSDVFEELMALSAKLNEATGQQEDDAMEDAAEEKGEENEKEEEEENDNEPINDGVEAAVKELGVVLANTFHVYHEAHGFHWNVKGPDFSQYHDLFGGIYETLFGSIDGIAEWILRMGYDAPFQMSELAALRTIGESNPADMPAQMAAVLLDGINVLIVDAKNLFDTANNIDEQGLADFAAGLVESNQKIAWKLRASLGLQKQVRYK